MEFRSLTNIETSFKQIRLYAAAFVVLCIVITGIVVYSSYAFADRQREKIYVLDNREKLFWYPANFAAGRPRTSRGGPRARSPLPRTLLHRRTR